MFNLLSRNNRQVTARLTGARGYPGSRPAPARPERWSRWSSSPQSHPVSRLHPVSLPLHPVSLPRGAGHSYSFTPFRVIILLMSVSSTTRIQHSHNACFVQTPFYALYIFTHFIFVKPSEIETIITPSLTEEETEARRC